MAQMDYFRRPILAGRNVRRLVAGTVRGSVRRKDADGTSTSPYFPGASSGQTLLIDTEFGTTFTATLTNNSMAQVLADINAALGTHGTAFDADGVIGLKTSYAAIGGLGWIQVSGGTAATALGFDTTLGRVLRSTNGDIETAPEGRIGNGFGTAFPVSGENFTANVFHRSLARLAANSDVLFADLMQETAVLQRVPFELDGTSGLDPSNGSYFKLPAATRIFNGLGTNPTGGEQILSGTSSVGDLAPYFAVVDATTKQILPYKVSAVVVSAASIGLPIPGVAPYANALNSADIGKNVLGLNLSKFGPTAITSIRDGRVVTCTGAGSACSVGDVVSISSSNTSNWSNGGMRWVVEKIIDANNLVLRPASKGLISQLGLVFNESQPVLELDDSPLLPGQSYGTLQIYTGSFINNVTLVLNPPAPVGGSYEVWAAQPSTIREQSSWKEARGMLPFSQRLMPFLSGSDTKTQLSAKRHSATSSADIVQALDQNGVTLTKIAATGAIVALPDGTNTTAITATGTGTGAGGSFTAGASGTAITAKAGASSTRAIQLLDSTGAEKAYLDPSGNLMLGPTIDVIAGPLSIGATNATGMVLSRTGQITAVHGSLTVAEGTLTPSIDALAAGALTIGGTNATSIALTKPSTHSGSATRGAINLVPVAVDPTTSAAGDLWVTTAGAAKANLNGLVKTLATADQLLVRAYGSVDAAFNTPTAGFPITDYATGTYHALKTTVVTSATINDWFFAVGFGSPANTPGNTNADGAPLTGPSAGMTYDAASDGINSWNTGGISVDVSGIYEISFSISVGLTDSGGLGISKIVSGGIILNGTHVSNFVSHGTTLSTGTTAVGYTVLSGKRLVFIDASTIVQGVSLQIATSAAAGGTIWINSAMLNVVRVG